MVLCLTRDFTRSFVIVYFQTKVLYFRKYKTLVTNSLYFFRIFITKVPPPFIMVCIYAWKRADTVLGLIEYFSMKPNSRLIRYYNFEAT